jgi:hypothetical protein
MNSAATLAGRDLLCRTARDGVRVVLRGPVGAGGETRLTVARWQSGDLVPGMTVHGRDLEALALDASGRLLVRCAARPGEEKVLRVRSGTARALASASRGLPAASCAVVREKAAGPATVLVQGAVDREEIVAFRPPHAGKPAAERWRLPGRGQGLNWPQGQIYGPVVADLAGDGRRQALIASASPGGCARLEARDLSGAAVWHHDFPEIPGTPPVWNTGGIVLWQVGHFTDARRLDVLVTIRRSMMHSEETALLSGRDGRELWRRDRQVTPQSSRGVGGTSFAIADYDGDGLDDVASLHPSNLYILKGATGLNLLSQDAAWDGMPVRPVYWGVPIAGDFEGQGRPSLLFSTPRRSMTGLVRADGSLAWWDALDRATTCLHAVGDFTGSGRLEIVGLGYDDGIRCYDAAAGRVLWALPDPAAGQPPTETASADVDGDGRDEALFTAGTTLYCIGAAGPPASARGELRWKLALPATVGPPVVADVDGDGTATILLVGADGWVYAVR